MSKHSHHNQENTGSSAGGTGEVKGNSPGVSQAGGVPPGGQGSGGAQDARSALGSAGDGQEKPAGNGENNQGSHVPETPEAIIAALQAELADQTSKIAELNDQFLRKAADFENFRKRMNREKQEITDFANQNLLLDLIQVIDDFERAIKSADTSKDFTSFYEGIVMIEKRLSTQLENKWGLKRFDSEGQLFDPNRHEALQMEKVAGITEGIVKEEYLKGYFLKERVIRCAKVKVLMPVDGASSAGQSSSGGEPGFPGLDREK